ncbi:MAG: efflux RND transporter periplasmic adaptor subunit [Nitratireductor sp.]|nr:efflux RND transporter periplasmic adaptor subunit [Nitratireductor sp.]
MAKIKLHRLAAFAVLAVSAAWVLTGEFSSVGSAASENELPDNATQGETVTGAPIRTVAYVRPPMFEHSRAILVSGHTAADKKVDVSTRAGGVILSLPFREGERVSEGDVILKLDPEERPALLANARATLAQRENELAAAEQLVEKGNMAKLRGDAARSALAAARWQVEQAEAEISKLDLKAPFSGTLDKVMVEEGATVQAGMPVASLIKLDPVIASGEVAESDLHFIKPGSKAEVRLVDGSKVNGVLRYISRQANAQTRTFPVEVEIANPDLRIPAGMTAEIKLLADPVLAVALPRSVVTLSNDGDLGIRILKDDDTVAFVPIDLVDDLPQGLLLGGVPKDAHVIVAGQDLVAEGEKVKAVEADADMIRKLTGASAVVN